MSARKKSREPQGTSKSSAPLGAKAQPKQKKPSIKQLPDLETVYNKVLGGYAIVHCATRALDESDTDEDEGSCNHRTA